ncbi:MAG: nicotinate-nucleotide--dimethylbenzimidazole phosphoribosyltransferase, partial [Hydrogenophaga sp.]
HALMLAHLKAEPLLDLGLRLGEGSGAALAWPLLVSACALLREMASFEAAGVSRDTHHPEPTSSVRPEPVEGHPTVLARASTGSARTDI